MNVDHFPWVNHGFSVGVLCVCHSWRVPLGHPQLSWSGRGHLAFLQGHGPLSDGRLSSVGEGVNGASSAWLPPLDL